MNFSALEVWVRSLLACFIGGIFPTYVSRLVLGSTTNKRVCFSSLHSVCVAINKLNLGLVSLLKKSVLRYFYDANYL